MAEVLWCSACVGEGADLATGEPCDTCRGYGWFDTVSQKPVAGNPLRYVRMSWLMEESSRESV